MMRPAPETLVQPAHPREFKDDIFDAAEKKDKLIPFLTKALSNDDSTSNLVKSLNRQNAQRQTPLHVAAINQDAASFIKLMKIAAKHHVLNEIALMQDENNKYLLHVIAEFQIEAQQKKDNQFYSLNEFTRLIDKRTLLTTLFSKDKQERTALSIIANKQEDRLEYVMESAMNYDLQGFHDPLFNTYPDGKIPTNILNRYLAILVSSHWLHITSHVWEHFFEKVDKDALREALIQESKQDKSTIYGTIVKNVSDYDNEFHKRLLGYVPSDLLANVSSQISKDELEDINQENEPGEIHKFRKFLLDLIEELDKFPPYRRSSIGSFFHVSAVNYSDKQELSRLARTQLRRLSPENFTEIKYSLYIALNYFRDSLVRNKGNNESRYLNKFDSFINSPENNQIKEDMRSMRLRRYSV